MTELPPGWSMKTLGEVASWGSGGTPPARVSEYYGGDIPWAIIGDLNDGVVATTKMSITDAGLRNSAAKWFPAGTVLVAMYGSIGKLGIAAECLTTNQAIAGAVPHAAMLIPRFLFYYLMSQRADLSGAGKGAAQQNIGQGVLKAWPIPVPPVDEQQQIVEILEDYLSRVDTAVAYLDAAKRRNEQLLRSVLWMHTHGIRGAKGVRLDSIAEVRLGRQRSPKNHNGNRMRPYLRAANVDWNSLRLDDVKEMHFREAEEATYRLRPGDILLTEASGSPAEVGKSVLYRGEPEGVCFQNTLLRVRVHGADPDFVQKYLLAEAMAGRFMPETRGVGINHLGRFRLAALEVELPPLGEQTAAARKADDAMAQAARLRMAIQEQEHRVGRLRRALLDAAFSGRLTADAPPSLTQREVMVG